MSYQVNQPGQLQYNAVQPTQTQYINNQHLNGVTLESNLNRQPHQNMTYSRIE